MSYHLLIWTDTGKIVEDYTGSPTMCWLIMDRYQVGPGRENEEYFWSLH